MKRYDVVINKRRHSISASSPETALRIAIDYECAVRKNVQYTVCLGSEIVLENN